ncbi:MAG: hypothetical protein H6832_09115 [Planctomycetes bacterium]|nr:hypothetical protein [Planctomycetota bacterium]MCB9918550.1 hypothetical protein [Planctomycetota bacterium]
MLELSRSVSRPLARLGVAFAAIAVLGTVQPASAQSDLVIESMTTPSTSLVAGAPLQVQFVVKNTGTAACPAGSNAVLRLSDNPVFSGEDIDLAKFDVPALAPGASKICVANLRVPYSTPSGTRYLVAMADVLQQVPETIEINNERSIGLPSKAWFGTPRVEYMPSQGQNSDLDVGDVSTWIGGRFRMCLAAPGHQGEWYLFLWSGQKNFVIDSYTTFSLELLNTQFQPRWFGRLEASEKAYPEYWMPSGIRFFGQFKVYVSSALIDPAFTHVTAASANSIELTIRG